MGVRISFSLLFPYFTTGSFSGIILAFITFGRRFFTQLEIMKFTIDQKTFKKEMVAEIFHTTERTVERWVKSGDLKGIRTAGTGNERSTIVFSEVQIEAFAELRRMKKFLVSDWCNLSGDELDELDPAAGFDEKPDYP